MKTLLQILMVTMLNLRNIPHRLGSSSVIVIGMAGVVAVLVSILAMAAGAEKAISHTGRPDRAIVLHASAISELLSNMSRSEAVAVPDAPGTAKDGRGLALASAETLVVVELPQSNGMSSNVTLRGVGGAVSGVRPEVHITEGRAFEPGSHELMVGKAAQAIFSSLRVGSQTTIGGYPWTVVGVFESGGDAHESELLADNETVLSAFHRENFQSVLVRLGSADDFATFRDALAKNPQVAVSVARESDFYAEQSRPFSTMLAAIAYVVGGIMAVGAFFGAINSMYSAVSTRKVEIATLRAIGFNSGPIVISIFVESLLLAVQRAHREHERRRRGARSISLLHDRHPRSGGARDGLGLPHRHGRGALSRHTCSPLVRRGGAAWQLVSSEFTGFQD